MKKIFGFIIMCILILPVQALPEADVLVPETSAYTEDAGIDSSVNAQAPDNLNLQEDIQLSENSKISSDYKQPTSKRKLFKKFLIAMLCVAGTSIFLYVILNLYNKLRDTLLINDTVSSKEQKTLDSPQDLTEAVKVFINNTKWD